nr:hypothetical protein [Tanacetum cinerariifolium]
RDDSQGEACPTDSGFIADQDMATIAKSSTLPLDSAPRVTSPAAEEGSMKQTLNELTAFCTSLQRQHLELLAKFQAQEVEINRLKERVKNLEDKEEVIGDKSGDDAPIKRRSTNEGEAPAEGIARDAEVARIHAEEEIQGMIDSLDKSNETVAKYLQKYQQFALDLSLEKKIELISDLVKYQNHYKKEEAERAKRQGIILEKEQVKKQKLSEEAPELKTPTEEVSEDKIKEMMQLVPVEDVLQRQHSEFLAKFQAQEEEINRLKERVKNLEDKKE